MITRMPETDFDLNERPAYGQVWRWGGSEGLLIFLVCSLGDGEWVALSLGIPVEDIGHDLKVTWHGLHDDPKDRLESWKRIE